MPEPRWTRILDGIEDPVLVMDPDARVTAMNRSACSRLPALGLGAVPRWRADADGDALRAFLARCLATNQSLPGVLRLDSDGEARDFRCRGARVELDPDAYVLLQVLPGRDRRFSSLGRLVDRLRRELSERAEMGRRLEELLAERDRMVQSLRADAARRSRAERERDEVLARLYRVHQHDRLRLARDLHDHAGQHIVTLRLGLDRLRAVVPDGRAGEALDALLRQVDDAGRELHRVAVELRPAALEEFGLSTALRAWLEDWGAVASKSVGFQLIGEPISLPSEAEVTLFRLVQEALTNIAKHAADARSVVVILQYGRSHASATVEDDGPGFDAARTLSTPVSEGGGFGLLGMAERLALVGGMIEIDSRPGGGGTTIFARIPVEGASDAG